MDSSFSQLQEARCIEQIAQRPQYDDMISP